MSTSFLSLLHAKTQKEQNMQKEKKKIKIALARQL